MTAMRDIAAYILHNAQRQLDMRADYPDFYCAFLDDDSDYLPAALDMMNDLMIALTDDNPDIASAELLSRITRDDFLMTESSTRYSELPLDANIDLPFAESDFS